MKRLALLLVLVGLGVGLWWRFRPVQVDRRQSAIWMGHKWFGAAVPEAECQAVADQLKKLGFTDLYFHVGPLDAKAHVPAYDPASWK